MSLSQTASTVSLVDTMMPFCDEYSCNCPPCYYCTAAPNNAYWDNSMVSPVAVTSPSGSSSYPGNMACSCAHATFPDASASPQAEDFRPYNPFEVKHRRRTSRAQYKVLEKTFQENPKPNATIRRWLAQKLSMTPRGVQVWFQNRRAKAKALQRRQSQEKTDALPALPDDVAQTCPPDPTPETRSSASFGGFSPVPMGNSDALTNSTSTSTTTTDAALACALQRQYSNASFLPTDDDLLMTPTASPHAGIYFHLGNHPLVNVNQPFLLDMNASKSALGLVDPANDSFSTWPSQEELALFEHMVPEYQPAAMAPNTTIFDPLGEPLDLSEPQPTSTAYPSGRSSDHCWTSQEAMCMASQPIFDFTYNDYALA